MHGDLLSLNLVRIMCYSLFFICEGKNKHGLLPFYSENDLFLSHEVVVQSVFCNLPWPLVVQYVEHLRMCHAKYPTSTKAIIVLTKWPQFKFVTTVLKMVEKTSIYTPSLPNRLLKK
jgi:hypothetical protein